mgnify:CR=1 FL=1
MRMVGRTGGFQKGSLDEGEAIGKRTSQIADGEEKDAPTGSDQAVESLPVGVAACPGPVRIGQQDRNAVIRTRQVYSNVVQNRMGCLPGSRNGQCLQRKKQLMMYWVGFMDSRFEDFACWFHTTRWVA